MVGNSGNLYDELLKEIEVLKRRNKDLEEVAVRKHRPNSFLVPATFLGRAWWRVKVWLQVTVACALLGVLLGGVGWGGSHVVGCIQFHNDHYNVNVPCSNCHHDCNRNWVRKGTPKSDHSWLCHKCGIQNTGNR